MWPVGPTLYFIQVSKKLFLFLSHLSSLTEQNKTANRIQCQTLGFKLRVFSLPQKPGKRKRPRSWTSFDYTTPLSMQSMARNSAQRPLERIWRGKLKISNSFNTNRWSKNLLILETVRGYSLQMTFYSYLIKRTYTDGLVRFAAINPSFFSFHTDNGKFADVFPGRPLSMPFSSLFSQGIGDKNQK